MNHARYFRMPIVTIDADRIVPGQMLGVRVEQEFLQYAARTVRVELVSTSEPAREHDKPKTEVEANSAIDAIHGQTPGGATGRTTILIPAKAAPTREAHLGVAGHKWKLCVVTEVEGIAPFRAEFPIVIAG
jgi:hypothetical protein